MAIRFEPALPLLTTRTFLTDANQDIKVGDPVTLVGGYVQKADATSAALLGVAALSVKSSTGEHLPISVWVGDDKNEFFGKCSGTAAITLQGTTCDIEIDGNGIPFVNEDATSKNVLLIVGKHPEDSWGAGTRVRFKINPAKSQYSA
ncbi:MAG TPA: hypothetical protein PKN66_08475 [Thermodesulfovibrio thiophilus]|nr:hypothetical protein [Thermodesulfovibrio thiophilus]